ncbi:MAG TPA: aminotransferase class V-fold PLP-dependent enzyme [Acetobacteraceae bacterium]|nr:aminotransferase class V-fold PLP-dependent enzyme [Acetobacteraceae bacterium]
MIYLDANASEPVRPAARAAVLEAMALVGNPASVHGAGRAARRLLEAARETIGSAINADPAGIVFTSGGTEADALAIHCLGHGRRLIVGATEHDAVRAAAPEAVILPVDGNGVARPDRLEALLANGPPALVCLMLANNETGTVQPVADAASICRRHGALLHVDAVQAAGRIPVDAASLGATSLALSSHKLGGPAGAGALVLAPDAPAGPALIAGGGQERGRRGGTPALPAIAKARPASAAALAGLRDAIEAAAIACGAQVLGARAPRLPNTTCLALPGAKAETQVIALDLAGIAVSAGAACSSGKVSRSHVLAAMGFDALAGEAIRVSLPWSAAAADVDAFATAYAAMAARLGAGRLAARAA